MSVVTVVANVTVVTIVANVTVGTILWQNMLLL